MSEVKRILTTIAHTADKTFDRVSKQINRPGKPAIVPYRWYGTADKLTFRGRVFRSLATVNNDIGQQLLNFASDEWPGAKLRVTFGDADNLSEIELPVIADDEGYFWAEFELDAPVEFGLHTAAVELLNEPERANVALAECNVPDSAAEHGIISDIDDTIIITEATRPLMVGVHTFLKSPDERQPFPDVVERYEGWVDGGRNPIFYVSSSPWNIYTYLTDFMKHHNIPLGSLSLRDIGFDSNKLFTESHSNHKLGKICNILDTYPDLSFILVGDSGQHDPEIYGDVMRQYPGRIKAVYIRRIEDKTLYRVDL